MPATPDGSIVTLPDGRPAVRISVPCECCKICRWCWCGGDKLPTSLTSQVTLTSTWLLTFEAGGVLNPKDLYNGITPVTVPLSLGGLGFGDCVYRGFTDTTISATVGCGSSSGTCQAGNGALSQAGSVKMRTSVSIVPCQAITDNGAYQLLPFGRFAIVGVGPIEIYDGYGNPIDCTPLQKNAEGVGLVGGQLLSSTTPTGDGGTGTLTCSGGHVTYDATTTIDHTETCDVAPNRWFFTGTTQIDLAVTD